MDRRQLLKRDERSAIGVYLNRKNVFRYRLGIALCLLVITTVLLVAVPSAAGVWLTIQPGPAWVTLISTMAATSVAVAVLFLIASLVFGRVFCAVFCPLGTLQDVGCLIRAKAISPRRNPKALRYSVAALCFLLLIGGWVGLFRVLDPFSRFAAFVAAVKGVGISIINGTSSITAGFVIGGLLPIIALVGLVLWRKRIFCVSLRPVGTVFGLMAKFGLYRLHMLDTCIGCGRCAKQCPTGAIDCRSRHIDNERCVLCMACVSECGHGGIEYSRQPRQNENVDNSTAKNPERRRFLFTSASAAIGVVVAGSVLTPAIRGLARASESGEGLLLPPGAFGSGRFARQCTSCLACAASCPNNIIKPSALGFGPVRLDYTQAGCAFDCTACNTVCPSGALKPLDLGSKQWLKIGVAEYQPSRCRVVTEGVACNFCAKACPMGAIFLVDGPEGLQIPEVAAFHCIGCGACQAVCPMSPKAITVKAVEQVE